MIPSFCIILTTTNDKQIAEQIASELLENSLTACLQIDNITSYFKWEGKINSKKEYRIMIKARADNYKEIESVIVKIHNYELPQILKLDIIDGLPEYLKWLADPSINT